MLTRFNVLKLSVILATSCHMPCLRYLFFIYAEHLLTFYINSFRKKKGECVNSTKIIPKMRDFRWIEV